MEALKDVFTPFYERLRRPFVGAFWVSWFFVNWKLWVALIFYKETVGGVDKITFIYSHAGMCNLLWKPLMYSIAFLLIMPWLDFLAFYWQQLVRSAKKKAQSDLDKMTWVHPDNHVKVVEEKEELKKKIVRMESSYQEIAKRAQKFEDDHIAHQRNLLQPSLKYFEGDWKFVDGQVSELHLRFTEDKISLVKFSIANAEPKQEPLYKVNNFFYKDNVLILSTLPLYDINQSNSSALVARLVGDKDKMIISKLRTNISFIKINLDKLYKNDFSFTVNGTSTDLIVERINDYIDYNKLFEDDPSGLMPMKDRKRPSD